MESTDTPLNVSAPTDWACYYSHQQPLHHKIALIITLMFVGFGLVGNFLSVVVFASRKMRSVSAHVYMLFLGCSDSAYLISVFLAHGLTNLRCLYFPAVHFDLMNRSRSSCLSLQLVLDIFSDFSPCLILAVTVERYIAVCHPLRFTSLCTVQNAKLTSATLFVMCVLVSTPYHLMYMTTQYGICVIHPDWELEFTVWYSIESVLFRIIPVIVVAILNVFIIFKITPQPSGYAQPSSQVDHRAYQLTIMLLLVSSSYIVLYLPVLAIFVLQKFQRSHLITVDADLMATFKCYAEVFYVLAFAINFLLYVLARKSFRDQLRVLLGGGGCKKRQPVHNSKDDTDATQL